MSDKRRLYTRRTGVRHQQRAYHVYQQTHISVKMTYYLNILLVADQLTAELLKKACTSMHLKGSLKYNFFWHLFCIWFYVNILIVYSAAFTISIGRSAR